MGNKVLKAGLDRVLPENPLFRLLFINGAIGVFVAVLFLAGILLADVGGLGTLIASAQDPVLPVLLLGAGLVITLASAAMGTAIMALPADDSGGRGPRMPDRGLADLLEPAPGVQLVPARVPGSRGTRGPSSGF